MADNTLTGLEIAVIGMAGRFPGAHDIHEFWDNLIDAKESITFFSDEELAAAGVKSDLIKDPGYVKAGPVLADTCYFDANFFGYSPAEAEVMVPQARIFHECAWAALEDAGYDPLAYQGTVGCYVGSSSAFPWQAYSFLTGKHQNLGDWPSLLLSSKDNLGTHLAYKLDLSGPCFTFFSACSTSLVAVHLGSRALLTGECRMAVVGAVTLDTIGKPGYLYQEGMISSPDGHCRAFAGDAAGTIFGEGAGAAILKRYREAVDDKDHIYAVIKGSAVNNDGLRRVGYTAPGSRGQQEVVELALKAAKVSPESITYVETHGTGTSLGDPVEFQALTEAFNTDKKQFCAIASVKTNIGHLDTAAGIAGFIKAVLALYHGLIPPGLHFDSPNPAIDFENGPFYVNTELKQWTADEYPLRAGVSSFGIGGTNAHVILEQASHAQGAGPKAYHQEQEVHGTGPMAQEPGSQGRGGVSPPAAAQEYQLILLSARTPTALQKMTRNLANYLKENQNNLINLPGHSLGNVAFTLQVGRRVFQHRRMAVCSTIGVAIEALTHPDDAKMKTFADTEKNQEPPVVFMFPGLGSEYVNMGRELYEKQPLFREEMNRCFEILKPLLGYDIKEILYPFPGSDRSYPSYKSYKSHINQTEIAQPVIFIFEYALAKILMDWGIKPRAVMGYSFGEYAAACAAGVFSLEDALKLVAARGRLVQEVEPGAMLSVPVSKQELSQLLDSNQELGLSLSIDNGLSCIAAGSNEAVDVFEKRLKEKKLLCMRLPVSRAFHSPMMAAVAMEFQEVVASLTRKPPQIPYVSNVTGTWIRTDQALDPGYWATHLRQPVCFADGLNVLVNKWKNVLFLEVGPGRDLSALITRTIENKPGQRVLHLVRHPQKQVPDLYFLMNQVGRLWLYGKSPDWNRLYPNEKRQRISLPTYPFDPHYYPSRGDPLDIGTKMLSPQMVLEKRPDISSWFYIPSWKRSLLPSPVILPPAPSRCWLLLVDNLGLGDQLAKKLENQKQEVILVSPGDGFSKTSQRQYTISPGQLAHYRALLRELQRTGKIPGKILHLWSVSGNNKEKPDREAFDRAQELGLYSLCHLAAAIGRLDFGSDFEIIVISDNIQEVTGRENLAPEKSTVMAVAKVIPQEYPYIICRAIDVVLEEPGSWREKRMLAQLHAELCAASPDTVIAYRDGYRWIQVFEPVRLEEIPGDIPSPRLKTGGVYLITGGLGGLGLTLAGFLARTLRAKLVLTTRSFFPARQEWDQWLVKHGENHNTSIKIRQIKEFEKAGAEVRVFNADAADESEMRRGINLAEEQWGPINGVIHAAGIPGGSASFNMIDKLAKPDFQEQFQAKVYGLLVLEKLLRNRPLDFCLLTSSLSPILGGVGFAAYSAANQFMDSFVYKHNRVNPPKWISLNWGDWQPWNPTERESIIGGTVNQFNMMPREGIETFRRILYYCQTSQVVVSSGDLRGRIDQWVKLKTLRDRDEANKPGPSPVYRRSHLSDAYIAPRDPWEQTLADIWQRLFGFDRIGIRDDFFELGGDSLKAITLAAKIHHQLKVEIPLPEFFERTTIETLARYTREQSVRRHEDSDIPLEIVEKKEYYLLSSAQERLFILQQMQKDFTGYNDQMAFVMEGILDKYRLERAFRGVIQRHESLRTSFHVVDEVPVQMVQTGAGFEIEYHQSLVNSQGRGEVSSPIKIETITREFVRSFDLACAPLLRVGLISLDNKKALLMIDMHHIVFDGTSMGILLDEVTRLYTGEEPPRLKIQYKDFSTWQNRLLKTGKIKRQEEYWLNLYRDSPDIPGLNLPYDYPRPHVMSFEGDYYGFRLAGEDILGFKALAVENDATLYMNLLAALKVLLYKYTGQDDIIVGSAIVGRPRQDLQPIIGMFVNTLALRSRPGQCQTYPQWLLKVKAACIKAFENQDLQFEDLVHRLDLQRDPSRNPLFDVCFAFQNFEHPPIQLSEITFTPYELKNKTSRFDMTIFAWEKPGEIVFGVEYCTRLFKPAAVRRFAGHLLEVIRQVSGVPGIRLADIEILTREEKQRLLYDFNDTARDYPADQTIHRLFAAEAANNPDQAALVGPHALHNEGTRGLAPLYITYRELNKKSGQFALVLKEKGIQPDTIVGIMAGRSIEMVIGILAILKAGAAYLSIDVEYPQKRIARMLADSSAKILVTTPGLSEKFEKLLIVNCQLLIINEKTLSINNYQLTIDNLQLKGDNLAYVIYTSGSTGIPKGVMVTHRNVVRLVKNTNYVEFKQGQRILPTGALEFDASTFEVWGALLNGLSLYLAPKEDILTVERLKESLEKYNISTIWMTSPLFNRMVLADPGIFAGLKNLLVGGDVLSPLHINQVRTRYPGVNIINGYGPTENTTFSTTFLIEKEYKTNIPIGTPIANSTAYIVDKYYRLQPINVPGELWVGGDGVSRGYMNDPELTAEKFDHDLWDYRDYHDGNHRSYRSHTSYFYRTGDLARWLPDGNIQFLGRIDHQVKISGFRIELGEIESLLLKHDKIKEAVVLAGGDGLRDKYLCAYIVVHRRVGVRELREFLSKSLPEYMIPSYMVTLEKIPLTPNGKVDGKALPVPGIVSGEAYIAPRDELEKKLVEIWSGILARDPKHASQLRDSIGIDDNFFELGGHSLKAAIMISRIHEELSAKIPLGEIFRTPFIRGLSGHIREAKRDRYISIQKVENREYYALSSAQQRMYLLREMETGSTAYNLPAVVLLQGQLNRDRFVRVFKQLTARHESFRTSFVMVAGKPVQRIHDKVEFEIEYDRPVVNCQGRGEVASPARIEKMIREFVRPFDLSYAPLLRVGLMELPHTPAASLPGSLWRFMRMRVISCPY
jgi:amino acid adenylation domain-containing protein